MGRNELLATALVNDFAALAGNRPVMRPIFRCMGNFAIGQEFVEFS